MTLTSLGWTLRITAVLATLCAAVVGYLLLPPRTTPPPPARPVTDARLLAAEQAPGEWLTYGRDYTNQRFSPLTQIDRRNVADLLPVWHFQPAAALPST